MPNNITNQITFGSDSAALAVFQRMLRDMRMEGQPLGSIDFNKLLPMPKELDMEDSDTMEFFTAWDSVPKIMTLLSKRYPEQTITYRWADENIGYNVGEMTLKGGEVIDINVPEDGSREAYEMAAEIMGVDLSDFNLCLTGDGTSYEYRGPDDTPCAEKGGPEPPPALAEQAKAPRKKRGAKGQDR